MKNHLLIALAALLTACTGLPEGVAPVNGFEIQRYLGTWYEIARLDHGFERNLEQVSATYSLRKDGGIRVVNRGFDVKKQEWKEAVGKAYFVASPDTGRLKVSFFGPFYGGYNIIALDKTRYNYALVAGPDRSYLWLLSRTPELPAPVMQHLIATANSLGFDTSRLILVEHAAGTAGHEDQIR
ncbi:MAG TPA: lipocalin family protein [Methylophilaceae bacterium]|jgi:apolipoprotein D and lipocalin family protein